MLRPGSTFANSYFQEMVRQPDGAIVLAGQTEAVKGIYNESTGFVQRRTATGALDTGFGGGLVRVPEVGGLTLQSDGRVLVGVPESSGCSAESTVRRLGPDGAPDPSFGKDGISAKVPFASSYLAVDAQGRIVVAGVGPLGPCRRVGMPPFDLMLARLLPNGALDQSFGQGGVARAMTEKEISSDTIGGLAIREDGSILVAGYGGLRAFTPAGAVDTSFGKGGLVAVGATPGALLELPGGKVALATSTATSPWSSGHFVVSRHLADGSLDPEFGGDGKIDLALGEVDTPTALAAGPEGSILLGGETSSDVICPSLECDATPVLVRFTSTGALDPGFGQAGRAALSLPRRSRSYGQYVAALNVTPGGQILFAGGSGDGGNATVFALQTNGTPYPNFGSDGWVADFRTLPSVTDAHDLAIGPSGDILTSAWSNSGSHRSRPIFFPVEADGSGVTGLAAGGEPFAEAEVDGDLQADGHDRFYSFTGGYRGVGRGYVARFDRRGRRDLGYGVEGKALLPPRFDVEALVVRRNGQALAVGRVAKRFGMAAFMLSPAGRPVRRFGGDGVAIVGFGPEVKAKARTGAFDRRGRVVLFGDYGPYAGMARLLPNGRPDPRFAYDGRQYYLPGLANEESVVSVMPGGRILVAAAPEPDLSPLPTTLIRFRPDGIRDRSFGRNGLVRVDAGASMVGFFAGRRLILVSGADGFGEHGVAIRAFRQNGSLDRSFGRNGVVTARTGKGQVFRPAAAARQPNGRIVVAGTRGRIEESGSRVELLRFR